jgi:hypothetical protein
VDNVAINRERITIGTISGGIVNFGGAGIIAPITITNTVSGSGSSTGSGEGNSGEEM